MKMPTNQAPNAVTCVLDALISGKKVPGTTKDAICKRKTRLEKKRRLASIDSASTPQALEGGGKVPVLRADFL